jgi:tRNA dimethylallyltransferase
MAAAKIALPTSRTIRAIEICLLAQKPLSEVHGAGRKPLHRIDMMKMDSQPERQALHQRIHARTDAMLQAGWLEEVARLMGSGLPETPSRFTLSATGNAQPPSRRALAGRGEETIQQGTATITPAAAGFRFAAGCALAGGIWR